MNSAAKTPVAGEDAMVRSLLPFVRSQANRLPPSYRDDAVSDGCLGAIEAVRKFDKARGVKLLTFAARIIRGRILDGWRVRHGLRTPL